MQLTKSGTVPALAILITVATAAGLTAAYRRFHVEASNRRVEIALEWPEIALLSQASGRTVPEVLDTVKRQHVSTVVVAEDTIAGLEQSGAVRPERLPMPGLASSAKLPTVALVDNQGDLDRILAALRLRGLVAAVVHDAPAAARTLFKLAGPAEPVSGAAAAPIRAQDVQIATSAEYTNLRNTGLGLPPDVVETVRAANMRVTGRIGNFPGVTESSARAALVNLGAQGASTVIFNGEEVLGYRGLEPEVAKILLSNPEAGGATAAMPSDGSVPAETVPVYGAVEFGKQKGDEKLSGRLNGAFVRVHSIQSAEMGQMEEDEIVDRFVRAAKERNIRLCYVRLPSFAGPDPLGDTEKFLGKISNGMARGSIATGGGLRFGGAHPFPNTGVTSVLFGFIALGAAAGFVWMLTAVAPLPARRQTALLLAASVLCAGAAVTGETGRKLVAFLVGVVYPTIACLVTFPGRAETASGGRDTDAGVLQRPLPPIQSLFASLRALWLASLITLIGIIQVVGLLATRPFMMRANQFLGIKAQHAVPLLLIAAVALAGGILEGDTWRRFGARALDRWRLVMAEPARYGMLALGIVAIAGLMLVVARTGNDAGVGVSGTELKLRTLLDRLLPVRPRTKEFLVGHPAYILALAWWWRGRRRLAVPTFVIGSLGQVSLLNTFCHIHTPLIVSIWRDGLGLLFGALIGAAIFLVLEVLFARVARDSGDAGARS